MHLLKVSRFLSESQQTNAYAWLLESVETLSPKMSSPCWLGILQQNGYGSNKWVTR